MNLKRKEWWVAGLLVIALCSASMSCKEEEDTRTGRARLFITDAPIDDANVEAVVISISRIELNGPRGWEVVKEFDQPFSVNILEYQNGNSYFITEETLRVGTFSEARFILNATEDLDATVANPPCYIRYTGGSKQTLYLPGGTQTGYKVKGSFTLAADATTDVTLDFDTRRSIVEAGTSGKFVLKPTVRIISNKEAGKIEGNFVEHNQFSGVVAYVYEGGTYQASETTASAGEARFANSVTSARLAADGDFTLAFLQPGTYDLILVANSSDGEFSEVIGKYANAEVETGATLEVNLALSILIE